MPGSSRYLQSQVSFIHTAITSIEPAFGLHRQPKAPKGRRIAEMESLESNNPTTALLL